MSEVDPRIFFAAERTLLAWVRTGIAVIGLGFVVSRFGLFVALMAQQSGESPAGLRHSLSGCLGIAFVLIGAFAVLFAARQHRGFVAALAAQELPRNYSKTGALLLALAIGALGIVLAAYLLFTQS